MSFKASHWAVHEVRGLRPVERVLLLVLSEYADDRDCAWPSQDRLAEEVETSLSTLRRCLGRLEALGLLTREHRWVMDESGDTHRATNVYQLHVGALPDWSNLEGRSSGARRSGAVGGTKAQESHTGQSDRYGEAPGEPVVDNSSDDGVFVTSTDTGQSDGYGSSGRLYRSKPGGIPVTWVTGISTPNHQENHQTQPDQSRVTSPGDAGDSGSGQVRSGRNDDRSGTAAGRARRDASPAVGGRRPLAAELPAEVVDLLGDCLPDSMQDGLDRQGALRIASLLRERLDAGWRPHQIRRVMDQDLPARVSRLSGLVASRLESNVDPVLAPDRVKAAAEHRRREAARRRSVEIAGAGRPAADPAFERALAQVRERMPGASLLECSMAAADLVERSGGGAAGVAS